MAKTTVTTSTRDARPSCQATTVIKASKSIWEFDAKNYSGRDLCRHKTAVDIALRRPLCSSLR